MKFVARFLALLQILVGSCRSISLPILSDREIFDRFDYFVTVDYEVAVKSIHLFHLVDAVDYNSLQIIKHKNRTEVIVGARDFVVRLDSVNLALLETFNWPPPKSDLEMCQRKGQSEPDCHNFIRLIQPVGDNYLICGTHAFAPKCTYRKMVSFNAEKALDMRTFDGRGFVPLNPKSGNTYVMSHDGRLFTGVTMDFSANEPAILRMLPQSQQIRTDRSNSRWLNDPIFIASFDIGPFIYVFFRESAMEAVSCGKFVYSRVARVCKNDVGLDGTAKWSTFAKARMKCTLNDWEKRDGFDLLTAVHYSEDQQSFFATFATQDSDIIASAICIFDMSSISRAFSGPYQYAEGQNWPWFPEPNGFPDFNCQTYGSESLRSNLTKRPLSDAKRYQLMHEAIQPQHNGPIHIALLESYSFVEVDTVYVKPHGKVNVIFVLTGSGLLKKFAYSEDYNKFYKNKDDETACLIEVVQITPAGSNPKFTGMKLLKESASLLISTKNDVIKIPVERCARHLTQIKCLESKDPYCGWDVLTNLCTTEAKVDKQVWSQNVDRCPRRNNAVDGQFGSWSAWYNCPLAGDKGENCLCRNRKCDKPAPKYGGKFCFGPEIQVANCTYHGSWGTWGVWSQCSSSCGSSLRSRRRFCSNPAPSFGGRVCLGLDTQQEFCPRPTCPLPAPPPLHGGWSDWSVWSRCSRPCDGGYQKRFRTCSQPTPALNGNHCVGNTIEYKDCNAKLCPELTLWSDWTQWMQSNITQSNIVELKRFRISCQSKTSDANALTMSQYRTEEKTCHQNLRDCGQSVFRSMDGNWSQWSPWSPCSVSCENGTQYRSRQCNNPAPVGGGAPCIGHGKEHRFCNSNPCLSYWSFWTDYSQCSATCGAGYKHRQRTCNLVTGSAPCPGLAIESVPCDSGPCSQDGFSTWSGWSSCNRLGVQVRIRPCISALFCKGIPDAQMQQCHYISERDKGVESNRPTYLASSTELARKLNWPLILSVIVSFISGVVLTITLSCYAQNRKKSSIFDKFCFILPLFWAKKHSSVNLSSPRSSPTAQSSPACLTIATERTNVRPSRRISQPAPLKFNIYTPPPTARNVKIERSTMLADKAGPSPYERRDAQTTLSTAYQPQNSAICQDSLSLSNKPMPYFPTSQPPFGQTSRTLDLSERKGHQNKHKIKSTTDSTTVKRTKNKAARNYRARSYTQDDDALKENALDSLLGLVGTNDSCSLSLKKHMRASLKTQDYL